MNKVFAKSGEPLAIYDTSNRTESSGVGTSKPDLGIFHKNDVNRGNLKDALKATKGVPGRYVYTARMGEVYAFIEVKSSKNLDPFIDRPNDDNTPPGYRFTIDPWKKYPDDQNAQYSVSALGQITRYAHVIQTRQFRTCVYSISVAGTTARLLRWDRNGVIVTESFEYKSKPEILTGFIWLFSKATNEGRGFDPSAVAVTSEAERFRFACAITRHAKAQLSGLNVEEVREEVDKHYWPSAVTRLTVGTGAETHSIWVSRPMFTSPGVIGRSTKGYWGVRCESDEVVFIKDIWRTNAPGVDVEGTILKGLLEEGVRNIPELVCHGDVESEGESHFLHSPNSEISSHAVKENYK